MPDLAVNGELTLGENIADLAGLGAAYDAYRKTLEGKALSAAELAQADRDFFTSYASIWCSKIRDSTLRVVLASDGHSPPKYRVMTVRNLDAWYRAFDVKPEHFREYRIRTITDQLELMPELVDRLYKKLA